MKTHSIRMNVSYVHFTGLVKAQKPPSHAGKTSWVTLKNLFCHHKPLEISQNPTSKTQFTNTAGDGPTPCEEVPSFGHYKHSWKSLEVSVMRSPSSSTGIMLTRLAVERRMEEGVKFLFQLGYISKIDLTWLLSINPEDDGDSYKAWNDQIKSY